MEAFYHHVGLRVVCCCLGMLDVEQVAQGGHREEVNWGPRSNVMTPGTPNMLSAHPSLKKSIRAVFCCGGGDRYRFWLAGGLVHDSEQVDKTF